MGPEGETAYLFGTIHSLPDDVNWRTPLMEQVIGETDILFVEIGNLDDSDDAASEFQSRAFDGEIIPILDRVPDNDRTALARALDAADIEPESLVGTETWAAALQLRNAQSCFSSENGVDRALLRELPSFISFESFERQFEMFDTLPEFSQVDLLMSVARERGCAASEARTEAWLIGDLDHLEAEIDESFQGNETLRTALVDDRNLRFAQGILNMHQGANRQRVFLIAVGTGHMIGETGLPSLLAEAGYTVTRIQ